MTAPSSPSPKPYDALSLLHRSRPARHVRARRHAPAPGPRRGRPRRLRPAPRGGLPGAPRDGARPAARPARRPHPQPDGARPRGLPPPRPLPGRQLEGPRPLLRRRRHDHAPRAGGLRPEEERRQAPRRARQPHPRRRRRRGRRNPGGAPRDRRRARTPRPGAPPLGPRRRVPLLRRAHARGDGRGAGRLARHRLERLGDGARLAPPRTRYLAGGEHGGGGGDGGRRQRPLHPLHPLHTPHPFPMTTDPLDRLERLFRAARMHPPDERAAFLDAACADDPALRAEVEALLAADADAEADGFLARPATGLLGDAARAAGDGGPGEAPDPLLDRLVGPYRVLRPLGEGGMGAVYLAVREEPFLRYVALKVVRAGLHAPEVVRRFEQERQILASLDHPNIARLLDGGVTDDGLPYFAMEYGAGRPLPTYCDEHRLSCDERLRLFRAVCEAVHYAHQNLVLHRDLKPSNILVATDGADGKPTVKLLDFGIAKVLNPHLSPSAMPVTRTALRVMTPEYASPEQVRGEPLSTASDVYSLGVVLYELLTGHRPYRITTGSTEEIVRVVCEQEPERPSTKVVRDETIARGNGEETITAKAVGAARGAHPERLRRRLRGDLDTVVLMALRKEPQRRYASAEQLGRDLDRYRQGLPVLAHRDSRAYRLGKLVRRHKTATALVLVVLASVVGFALFSSWQARRVAEERDRAQTAQAKAEQVAAFLVSLFGQADPTETLGDTLTVREVLDAGARRVEAELAGQPEVQAAVLSVIAQAYRSLGRSSDAVPLLERALALRRKALGNDHPDT